jgi:chemotaxis protein methyltransferase CheR
MDATSSTLRMREFMFSEEDFQALRKLVKEHTGINLTEQKRELVYGRLARRLRALNLRSFRDYRDLVGGDGGRELVNLVNAITTNLTAFLREPHHFEYLRTHVLQPLLAAPPSNRRLRLWSAGCSTGEEPYSIAMTILESVPDIARWDIRILATDLDSDVLERARRGRYTQERLRPFDAARRDRFFVPVQDGRQPSFAIRPEVARLVTFKQLNLMHPFPMKGPFEAIFCRNTVIYFDKDTQRELIARMTNLQRPGHLLFLGHSETLFKVSGAHTLVGRTIYRRN